MNNRIIILYCDAVIKPLEMRKKELEKEIYTKHFISDSKRQELKLVTELLLEKMQYLAKLLDSLD